MVTFFYHILVLVVITLRQQILQVPIGILVLFCTDLYVRHASCT